DGHLSATTINNFGTVNFSPNAAGKRFRSTTAGDAFTGNINNKAGGVINVNNFEFEIGAPGANLKLVNEGTINLFKNLRFRGTKGFDNRGRININENASFFIHERIDINTGSSFNSGGTIELFGYWSTNVPQTLYTPTYPGPNTFIVNGGRLGGAAELKVESRVTFNGQVVIGNLPGSVGGAKVRVTGAPGWATMNPGTRIQVLGSTLTSDGVFSANFVNGSSSIELKGSSFINNGEFQASGTANDSLVIKSDSLPSIFTNNYRLNVNNGGIVKVRPSSSAINFRAGILIGNGQFILPSTFNTAGLEVFDPRRLTITGGSGLLTNETIVTISQDALPQAVSPAGSLLTYDGNLTLRGTLKINLSSATLPFGEYKLISARNGTISGSFTNTQLPPQTFVQLRDSVLYLVKSACAKLWYRDNDNDGYGDPSTGTVSCAQPAGFVDRGGDCNDNNPAVHPGAVEINNGIDDNCNGQVDESTSLAFRTIRNRANFWNDTLSWELYEGGIWKPAYRVPNGQDSLVTVNFANSLTVNTVETAPRIETVDGSNFNIIAGGDLTLWGTNSLTRGNFFMREGGVLRSRNNTQQQTLTTYAKLEWTGGLIAAGINNRGDAKVLTGGTKTLNAPFKNYLDLDVTATTLSAISASGYIENYGWLDIDGGTITSVPGTVVLRNIVGGTVETSGFNKIDGLINRGTFRGDYSNQIFAIENTGRVIPWVPSWKGQEFGATLEFNSSLVPTGTFDLYIDIYDWSDLYKSNKNIDLGKIRLHVNDAYGIGSRVDTIIRSTTGLVSGDFASLDLPSHIRTRKGANFVVIEMNPTMLNASAGPGKAEIASINKPFIPTVQRRSQVFRIQGLQKPADAVMILDVNGKQVFTARSYGNNSSLNQLTPGIHFYRVITREGKVYTGKIMITD
ncbi:MAG: T9SS type A sorting domain-containing protein, partial [Pedobacter sp.]